ncbi:zincin-like metallopeptidase domain-containing protein [Legionella quinlivanii]|uniref:zincin-like metallopeptidase domain-containing protein n=1 Tax=Legionella quinlivanii TaxID=45073 RepID=UPI002243F1BF|nr:zincin-like metallopeptidase domain-containing protein [Legionella quinlivanii]MCW8452566.1 zincin-like metallopeptidase domain-containing protein [Legionella quinlivanii]
MDNIPYHHKVAIKIIEQLKEGTAPWLKPWNPGTPGSQLPMNPVTGKRYKGINTLILMQMGHADNRWLTYKQAQSIGAQVRKGEKGTLVQYWKFADEKVQKDDQGNPILNQAGEPITLTVKLERPQVFYATVFNASQMEGLSPIVHKTPEWSPLEKAEALLTKSGAAIHHSEMDRAFYRITSDEIHLPLKSQFDDPARYYATALHELGHWTGHESRLKRDLAHPFGSVGYAKEELRAEIASLLLGDELGIGHDPSQHTAYIKSWIKALEDDPMEIFRAAADAEKITYYLHSLEQQQEHTINPHEDLREDNTVVSEPMVLKPTIPDTIWLNIPYHQKETAKTLAGTLPNGELAIAWDKEAKKWYAKEGANLEALHPWLEAKRQQPKIEERCITEKKWLALPYEHKESVKSIVGKLSDGTPGIAWDHVKKCWYANPGVSLDKIQAWLPNEKMRLQKPACDPREEFKDALISAGFFVTADHPIMNGKKHRLSVEGDKKGETAGFYVGFLDGLPAGYFKNNRTGLEMKWRSKGYILSEDEKAALKATALEKAKHREAEIESLHQQTSMKLKQKLSRLQALSTPTPYLESKAIDVYPGVFTDKAKRTTYIPAYDQNGEIWTMQYIREDGTKRFAKNSRKEGCCHVIGGMESLASASVMIIAEGYATAATLKKALDLPVVVAFDAGNLKAVAERLNERYPHTPILIAADDDKHLELTTSKRINPGKEKALEAAIAVNGQMIVPVFAPGEQLDNPRQFSDFNDLANNSRLGLEGVKRQTQGIIKEIISKSRTTKPNRTHKHVQAL